MEYEEKIHPTLGILVRSNGEVFVPANGNSKAHWTFGNLHHSGYRRVRINGKEYLVHRIVAETFLGPCPENKSQVDHINRSHSNPLDNRKENLRWASPSDNQRNTRANDRVDARGGTHWYENEKQYRKEKSKRWCHGHKTVLFSDGKTHWVGREEALLLLAIPVNQRIFKE